MNKGIEILLARMDSNPDEFMGINNKWVNLMDSYEDHMVEEDRKALYAKYSALHMDKFTEHVMKKLLAEQEEKKEEFGQYISAVQQKMQQAQLAQQNAMNQAGSLTGLTNTALGSCTVPASAYAHATISGTVSNQAATQLQLGKQTLTEKTLKKLKALVK